MDMNDIKKSSIDKVRIMRLEKEYVPAEGEKSVGGSFFIPKYQRGYRWTSLQVEQLLEDINESPYDEAKKNYYCLQPVVVQKEESTDRWIVVDGQQRLTTIFIVLACLRNIEERKKKPIYDIEYESKPELWDCLKSLGEDYFVEVDYSDIDKYHITNAYNIVREWVRTTVNNPVQEDSFASKLETKIKEGTCIIWYEVSNAIAPETTFTNINMGKIPLTNAELIKALLLKKDNFREYEDVRGEQARISMAWDIIENSLHKKDFWLFITNDKSEEKDVRIEMVFDIMARHILRNKGEEAELENLRQRNKETYLFLIFTDKLSQMVVVAKKNAKLQNKTYRYSDVLNSFWQEINEFYQMFLDWYGEREWYHLVGYWISARELDSKKTDVNAVLYELSYLYKDKSKTYFTNALKKQILGNLFSGRNGKNDEDLAVLTYDELKEDFAVLQYNGSSIEKKKIHKILLLFNIVTVQNNLECASRFPFHYYKQTVWNIEHIHSVTTDFPSREIERRTWVDAVKKYLDSVDYFKTVDNKDISKRLEKITDFKENSTEFQQLYTDVSETFSGGHLKKDDLENNISNLTLLDEHTNKSYQNDIFPMKRKYIMSRMGAEHFIPICTKNVFLKYYTKEVKQFYVWDEDDRVNYFEALCSTIYKYLMGKDAISISEIKGEEE